MISRHQKLRRPHNYQPRHPRPINIRLQHRPLSRTTAIKFLRRLTLKNQIKMTRHRTSRGPIRLEIKRQRNTNRIRQILNHSRSRKIKRTVNLTISNSLLFNRHLRRNTLNLQHHTISLINRRSFNRSQPQIRNRHTTFPLMSQRPRSIKERRIKNRLSTQRQRTRHQHRHIHRHNLTRPKRILRRRITTNRRNHRNRPRLTHLTRRSAIRLHSNNKGNLRNHTNIQKNNIDIKNTHTQTINRQRKFQVRTRQHYNVNRKAPSSPQARITTRYDQQPVTSHNTKTSQ